MSARMIVAMGDGTGQRISSLGGCQRFRPDKSLEFQFTNCREEQVSHPSNGVVRVDMLTPARAHALPSNPWEKDQIAHQSQLNRTRLAELLR